MYRKPPWYYASLVLGQLSDHLTLQFFIVLDQNQTVDFIISCKPISTNDMSPTHEQNDFMSVKHLLNYTMLKGDCDLCQQNTNSYANHGQFNDCESKTEVVYEV